MNKKELSARLAGDVSLGGEISMHRLGFGAMRLTGEGIWGPPKDRKAALAVLRRAVELEINFIDTADSYGPNVSEELIAEALFPYPSGLVIATKGAGTAPALINGLTMLLPRTFARRLREASKDCAWTASTYINCIFRTRSSRLKPRWKLWLDCETKARYA